MLPDFLTMPHRPSAHRLGVRGGRAERCKRRCSCGRPCRGVLSAPAAHERQAARRALMTARVTARWPGWCARGLRGWSRKGGSTSGLLGRSRTSLLESPFATSSSFSSQPLGLTLNRCHLRRPHRERQRRADRHHPPPRRVRSRGRRNH